MKRLQVAWLPDGKRLHLRNGPLDLITQAFGKPAEIGRAYDAGIERARGLVCELAEDLPRLHAGLAPQRPVGLRAAAACVAVPGALPAVVALNGAVADEVMAAMACGGQMERGFVNNRGMLAYHLTPGHSLTPVAMDWHEYQRQEAKIPLSTEVRSRGISSAGWRFDGFALGYVERIFCAAPTAAVAEAAVGSIISCMRPDAGLEMVPADRLAPSSMLGGLKICPVQPNLAPDEAKAIMAKGRVMAEALVTAGTLTLAVMELGREHFLAGPPHFTIKSLVQLAASS